MRGLHDRRTALITGASGGIGYELAKLFATDHHDLILVARNYERLQEITRDFGYRYDVEVLPLPYDLSEDDAPRRLLVEVAQQGRPVDFLVNNAGFATWGPFAETDPKELLSETHVNMVALTHLTRLFLPGMLARKWGRIMNVSSTAAYQPGPLMAVYYASKAYVQSFSEALANELRGTGVTVTALTPGPTHTDFRKRAGLEVSRLAAWREMDPALVARAGYRGMLASRRVVIPGWWNLLMANLARVAPPLWTALLTRSLHERRKTGPE